MIRFRLTGGKEKYCFTSVGRVQSWRADVLKTKVSVISGLWDTAAYEIKCKRLLHQDPQVRTQGLSWKKTVSLARDSFSMLFSVVTLLQSILAS